MPRVLSSSIADWIVPWRERPWPLDWAAEFGREAPLALEIGFGNGEFLEREAKRHPERNHVGIELSWTSVTYLLRRLDKGGAPHARVVLASAEVALTHLFAPGSLCEVFVNHPCPWPKERHQGRRLIRHETLPLLADRMELGAPLTIVTDHAAYATWIAETLERQSALRPARGSTEVAELPGRETTKYERKALAAGVSIHYFPWRKEAEPGAVGRDRSEPLSATEMPSLILERAPSSGAAPAPELAQLLRGFETQLLRDQVRGVQIIVKLIAAFRREGAPSWLVHALVKEDHLQQELALEVVPHASPGNVLVKLSPLGHAHPTAGVKSAVWQLGAWITARHPQLRVAHHNLGARFQAGRAS